LGGYYRLVLVAFPLDRSFQHLCCGNRSDRSCQAFRPWGFGRGVGTANGGDFQASASFRRIHILFIE
jgi:hypothetical protein